MPIGQLCMLAAPWTWLLCSAKGYVHASALSQGRSSDRIEKFLIVSSLVHASRSWEGLASRMELNGNSEAPGSPRSPRDISRTGSGVKGTLNVDDATRQKVCHGVTAFSTPSDMWGHACL